MATLVLATVGTAIAGPIGGLVGSFLGASIDRRLFGSGSQTGARASNLAVQSSAYGEAIPRFYGRMRAAGNLIWCPGIREAKGQSGGGKQRSGSGYSYSASFAVALAARQIHGIGRIWADGKLMRNADGSFVSATTMRIYFGTEGQLADPLIVGAEGTANAPAYRGLAYVVFENLALADFANRIPNLTFEIIADDDDADAATVATDLFGAADVMLPTVSGAFPVFHGFAATRAGNLRTQLEALAPLADLSFADNGSALVLRSGDDPQVVEILAEALGAAAAGETGGTRQQDGRGSIATVPDALAIGFFDPARDYQLGLQRVVRRSPAVRNEQRDFAVALAAPAAKALAERLVGGALAARTTAELRVSWQHLPIGVGDTVFAGGDTQAWRVRSLSFESMVLRLSVERTASVPRRAAG
ncbi:MAG: phage tail protein, partial [Polymorphobacter sp.]